MKGKYITFGLSALLFLGACSEDETIVTPESGGAHVYATIGDREEGQTKAGIDPDNGTYNAFENGDKIGIFATDALQKNKEPDKGGNVFNLQFELQGEKWGDGTADALLKWDTQKGSADIYGYFPYDGLYNDATKNYNVFTDGTNTRLKDILVAQRTTVENNNPAIFLTFKHRFSLLRLTLGTGMQAVTDADDVFGIVDQPIAPDAGINTLNYVVKLKQGSIDRFKAEKKGTDYYVILPGDRLEEAGDSIKLTKIKIGGDTYDLENSISLQPGTLYNLTMHKGEGGSISFEVTGIQQWGNYQDVGGIREKGGIYWSTDMRNLINTYNNIIKDGRIPTAADKALETYGQWNDEKNCWEFPVMRDIDMTDISDGRMLLFNDFTGIFNGNGYTIKGFDIGGPGLFAKISSGEVKDLTLENIAVNGSSNTGALAGEITGNVIIHNCHITGTSHVSGGSNTGGLIGIVADGATISRCSSTADVNGTGDNVGGLIGQLGTGSPLTGSHASGRITSTGSDVGGLVGSSSSPISDCYAACNVSGQDNVGGLVGVTTEAISNSYAVGEIISKNNAGGLVAQSSASVTRSSSGGSVSGENITGGLIGVHNTGNNEVKVTYCYSRSTVSGAVVMGGLIGQATKYEEIIPPVTPPEGEEGGGESPDPGPTIVVHPRSSVSYCYATNGKRLVGNDSEVWIQYSYTTGPAAVNEERNYYTIDLNSPGNLNELVVKLNTEAGVANAWTLGTVIIDGSKYTLPVLTSNNN